MYDQGLTTAAPVGQLGTPVGPGMLASNKVSPLQGALNTSSEQIDKLGGLLGQLEDRLASIRNSSPMDEQSGAEPEPPTSPVVRQVLSQISQVKNLQRRVDSLLNELEV